MQIKLTPSVIDKLATPGVYWDMALPGFGVVVTPGGHKSFVVQYRNAVGRSRRETLKRVLGLDGARREARKIQGDVERGLDPVGEKQATRRMVKVMLKGVFDDYERLEGGKLRSAGARRAVFARHLLRPLGYRPIKEIRRGEIVALLDDIQAGTGPRTANIVLMLLRRVMTWHAVRDETFVNPIVKGMDRQEAGARDRVLSDDEIRALWNATADQNDPFNRLVRFALLTATRRDEAGTMRWQEVREGVWSIPASRYKTNVEMVVPLSDAAQAVLFSAPKIGGNDWAFTIDGKSRIGGFSRRKKALDARIRAAGVGKMPPWTLHDLRRTARSLMSRAGVPADHAERCLGHVIGGVRGVYDRHEFSREKREAFEALAAQIARILNPTDNVVPLRGGKTG
jgi:integrase